MKSNFKNIGEMFKYYEPSIYKGIEVKEIVLAIKKEIMIILEEKIREEQKRYDHKNKDINMSEEKISIYLDEITKSYPKIDSIVVREIVFGKKRVWWSLLDDLRRC